MTDMQRRDNWLRAPRRPWLTAVPLLLFLSLACWEAGTAQAPTAVLEIDWRTSPLDLNLRGLNGERFSFRCPPGKAAPSTVIGSGLYTDASSICAAAVHAGVLHAADGGLVAIEVRPGESHYAGSLEHYIRSESYDAFWSGSFLIIAAAGPGLPGHAAVEFSPWTGGRQKAF
jgi:LCCL domain